MITLCCYGFHTWLPVEVFRPEYLVDVSLEWCSRCSTSRLHFHRRPLVGTRHLHFMQHLHPRDFARDKSIPRLIERYRLDHLLERLLRG